MRDSIIEGLREEESALWARWKARAAKKFPEGHLVRFLHSSRARSQSEGKIIGLGQHIGFIRVRYFPRNTKNRWGRELGEWEWKVRDIDWRVITDVLAPVEGRSA